jgi:hypothetical protein
VFYTLYVPLCYKREMFKVQPVFRVDAGSNNSTVALRVVGGDEKGTQCLGVQLDHPIPGGYKYGDLVLRLGEFRK